MQTFQYQVKENSSSLWKTVCCCHHFGRWPCFRRKSRTVEDNFGEKYVQQRKQTMIDGDEFKLPASRHGAIDKSNVLYNDNSLSDEDQEKKFVKKAKE